MLLSALLLGGVLPGAGLEPTTSLANFNRQSWVMENGLPQNTVLALAQTRDGFLWLGTEVGLVRFDGSGFATFDAHSTPGLPGSDVQCLLAGRDGALWVGTSDGVARLKDGVMTAFTTANGLPGNDVRGLAERADGGVQVETDGGTADFDGRQFQATGAAASSSLDPGVLFSAKLEAGDSAKATATAVTIRHERTEIRLGVGRELPGTRIQALLADRAGALWIGTNGGLARWAEGKLEKLPVTDPLASASVLSLLEDREGNLWAGTESSGLQILRDQRFRTWTVRDGLASDNTRAVVQDSAGTLWIGTAASGVTGINPDGRAGKNYSVNDGLASNVILSLAAAPDGDLWVGTPDGLSRVRHGAITTYTSSDGLPDEFIRSLLVDRDGSLWIGTRRGLAHWEQPGSGRVQIYTQGNGLGNDLVGAMARDGAGDLWVATFAGLSRLHNGQFSNFTTANGLSSNVITSLLARANGTLVVGTQDHGWNVWDGQRFTKVTQDDLGKTTIHAVLDDGLDHLWFATGDGLARCDCSMSMSAMCTHWMQFGTADGLHGRETAMNSHPSAWRSQNGHLWFATPKGLVEIDPAHFPVNDVPPPVVVERFAADDHDQLTRAGAEVSVAAGHNHFQFDYAGLSFVAPQKVRYRYKLEGFDHGWTEAGARRTAYYTNIPPGKYTFRVQAANNDGVWNTQGAALEFKLQPHFYQTWWFYGVVALGLGGVVLLLFRLRLLRAEREFRAVLGERNRIAREIHDTLAQGYVGISVQLEVLSELLRHNKVDAAAKHLNTTRGYVREGLADARQSIWALRSQDADETTLPVRMRRLVEQSDGHGLEARFSIYGAYRPLPPGTEREFLRVAQEAIHNVKKHAGAHSLSVQLEYGRQEIALEVRDDGRGFVESASNGSGGSSDTAPGHYGLTGMRERAAAVGGTLEIQSEPGAGTTVRLRAPSPKGAKE